MGKQKSKNNPLYFVIFIAALVVLYVGVMFTQQTVQSPTLFSPTTISNQDITNYNIATQTNDPEICKNIIDKNSKSNCYAEIGANLNNIEICKKSPSGEYALGRYQTLNCYTIIAIKNSDPGICAMSLEEDSRNDCYRSLGIELKNNAICEMATGYDRDWCLSVVVPSIGDAALCQKITDEKMKGDCLLSASGTGDVSLCDAIQHEIPKDQCYYLNAIALEDSSLCLSIMKVRLTDFCYVDVAVVTQDFSLCDFITDTTKISECKMIESIANVGGCSIFPTYSYVATRCIMSVAIKTDSPELCTDLGYYAVTCIEKT